MPRTCTVCAHERRADIDKALVGAASFRDIAGQYGVTKSAVERHRGHLPVEVMAAAGEEKTRQALDVLAQLKAVNQTCLYILNAAMVGKSYETALKAVDRVQRQIELQAKLLGDLDERPVVNVLISAEWTGLRGRILAALAPYPDARLALVEALEDAQ